jgi:hemerythrin-like domain-containing protein
MAQDPAVQPEFGVLHAMLQYIDAYPERLHHPNEETFLFTPLVRHAPEARVLVDTLSGEHEKGARLIRELQRALLALEIYGPAGAPAFGAAVDVYASFHWDHMRKEERELLPLAERYLSADDWRAAERAFAANDNPIAGASEEDFAKLFSRIANLAPAPVGFGTPWKRVSA